MLKTRVLTTLVGVVCLFLFGWLALKVSAAPNDLTWDEVIGAKVQVADNPGSSWKSWYMPNCQPSYEIVQEAYTREYHDICYVTSAHMKLAVYQYRNGDDLHRMYAIKRAGDDVFHILGGIEADYSNLVLLPDDTVVGLFEGRTVSIADFSSQLDELFLVPTNYRIYTLNMRNNVGFTDSMNNDFQVRYLASSQNNQFVVAQTYGYGLVRINLQTREVKMIADNNDDYNYDAGVVVAISNDGNSVVVTGNGSKKHKIYTGIDNCGVSNIEASIDRHQICHYADFTGEIIAQLAYGTLYEPAFSEDGRSVTVKVWNEKDQKSRKVTLTPDPSIKQLDYLALGDSYTSGEGDTGRNANGKKYYLPGTDTYPDLCHVSSRSYPFLLRNDWGMASSGMKSVACSGAQVLPDYYGNPVNYYGQGGRLSRDIQREITQQKALTNFTPGHVQQIEFVKKYQPKLVTFTGGGNDVGFADILRYCASPEFADFLPIFNNFADCGFAVRGSELEKLLRNKIDTQYTYTKNLTQRMQTASPATKIVLIGYPSFITHETSSFSCVLNSGILSSAEIKMMNTMVDRMNSMLRRVASDMQITYVDITHALDGGRICEGSEYMTGVWKNKIGEAGEAERFHPNAQGHQRMANVIKQANINTRDDNIPGAGTYEESSTNQSAIQMQLVGGGVTIKTFGLPIHIEPGMLMPNTTFRVTIHSTPKQLGIFTTDANGSGTFHLSLDGVGIGQHVLVVEGVDENNNPMELYQFVEVKASENDADGDGILDEDDPCQYIVEWHDETTGENVCTPSPTLTLGGYSTKDKSLSDSRKVTSDDSSGFVLASHLNDPVRSTKHATITNKPATKNEQLVSMNGILISIVAVVLIGTAGGVIHVYRKSKQD